MADIREVAGTRTVFRCSSSIENFKKKLEARLQLPVWHWWKNRRDNVIFFGVYHLHDLKRVIWAHWWGANIKIFWCGSDILATRGVKQAKNWLAKARIKHYCENDVEQAVLEDMGINAEIRPMIFDDPDKYQICYVHRQIPVVYINVHPGREHEYGLHQMADIASKMQDEANFSVFDGSSPERLFNERIATMQGALRFNEFDGFSEVLAKSVLMGQYPISAIKYPMIDQAKYSDEWMAAIRALKDKKEPNTVASEYWRKTLKENFDEIVNNWSFGGSR